ncbi:hypothetical protein P8452_43492 [Trifolium repens]|nr:hypothetical protein P8452_43492 [Trifolium repens]
MIDEGSDDQKHDSAEEGESGAGNMMAEAVQKEKRTKKRHDRPSASEEDQNLAKPAKKLKFASPNHPSKASVQLSYLLPLVLLAFEFRDIDVSPPTSTQSGKTKQI